MKIINLFGGPNTGKSTAAAGLFYVMKIQGYNVELASEYAKKMVFERRSNILRDQLYILAKQNRELERLRETVEWVVTDSPILLGVNYAEEKYFPNLLPIAMDAWNSYDNISFYLKSAKGLQFLHVGREQTPEEAKVIDDKIYQFLIKNNIDLKIIDVDPDVKDPFSNHIKEILDYIVSKK